MSLLTYFFTLLFELVDDTVEGIEIFFCNSFNCLFFQNIDHIFRLLVKLSSGIGQHQFFQPRVIGNGLPFDVALFSP